MSHAVVRTARRPPPAASVRGPAYAYAASQPDSADFQRPFQTRPDSEYTAMSPSSYLLGVSGYWRIGLALAMACGVSNAVQVPPPRHRVLRRCRCRAAELRYLARWR
eukprot:scaffold49846_cov61-Phaeocystis_antarctica.AAC.2